MRSIFKILFYVKRNDPKKDGCVPVMCRISVNTTYSTFSARLSVDLRVWDTEIQKQSCHTSAAKQISRELAAIRKGVEKHYKKIFSGIGPLTAERVRNSYLGLDRNCRNLIQIFEQHNQEYARLVESGARSESTLNKYINVCACLKEYIRIEYRRQDIALEDLRYEFITGFELYLRKKRNCSNNTVCLYLLPLRRMVAIAIDNGWLAHNPFSGYVVKIKKTERGYLTSAELSKLMNASYAKQQHQRTRDLFIFSSFTGVPYMDLQNLTKENLKLINGNWWLCYRRSKTGIPCNLRLLDVPMNIINQYKGACKGGKLFPAYRHKYARTLIKEAAKLAGIDKPISWHISRHTFATEICLMNGVPIETISRMLGHTNVKTTQIYTRISDTIIERDMQMLVDKLNGKNIG